MNQEVTDYIEKCPGDQQEILKGLRTLIFSIAPQANEQFKWSRPVYGLKSNFCYLKTNKKYVTLGFFDFEKIKTNSQLLEGTGKDMRHIKLDSVAQIAEFHLAKMIAEALD